MHACPDCGMEHEGPAAEPVAIPVPVESGPNENDVKIAEIEAAASIQREKIWTEQQALALEADREQLLGEIRGMREVLDRLMPPEPELEPVPVPVPAPAPEPEAEPVGAPPETPPKAERKAAKTKGFFG